MSVLKNDITNAAKQLGVVAGDIVLVHSSMKSLGYVDGGPDTVIDGFLEAVGEEGTLVMPTLSQTNFGSVYKDWRLDRPSDVGLLTEVFRKRPEAKRSDQATHSVAAIGKEAQEITEGHTDFGPRFGAFGDYAFSYSSPWQKMYDKKAKVVFIGVNMKCNTFKHFAEYRFVEKILKSIEGMPGYEKVKNKIRHFNSKLEYVEGVWPFIPGVDLHDAYIKAGLVKSTKCGEADLYCMSVYECVNFIEKLLDEEPEKWLNDGTKNWLLEVENLLK